MFDIEERLGRVMTISDIEKRLAYIKKEKGDINCFMENVYFNGGERFVEHFPVDELRVDTIYNKEAVLFR